MAYNPAMTPNDLLSYYGTKAEIARVSGCTPQSVVDWFDKGEVPETRQYQFELATEGQLRAARPADRRVNTGHLSVSPNTSIEHGGDA